MTESPTSPVRARLRAAMMTAMKARDRGSAAVYRAALGAIDNAEAVPMDGTSAAAAIETSAVGAGRGDVPRRELAEDEVRAVVRGEIRERREAADLVAASDPARADALRREVGCWWGWSGSGWWGLSAASVRALGSCGVLDRYRFVLWITACVVFDSNMGVSGLVYRWWHDDGSAVRTVGGHR